MDAMRGAAKEAAGWPAPPISVLYGSASDAPKPVHPDCRPDDLGSDPELLDALFDIFRVMQYAETDLERLLGVVVRKVVEMVGVDLAWTSIADPSTGRARLGAVSGNRIAGSEGLDRIEGLGQTCIRLNRTAVAVDYLAHAELAPSPVGERLRQEQVGTLVATPMVAEGVPVGVLYAATRDSTVPSEDACWLLSLVAAQASLAISNGRLLHEIEHQHQILQRTLDAHDRVAAAGLDGGGLDEVCRELGEILGCDIAVDSDVADGECGPRSAPATGLPAPTRSIPLVAGNDRLGELHVFGDVDDEHDRVLRYAASTVTVELLRRREATEAECMMKQELLSHLLDGAGTDEPLLAQRAARLSVDLRSPRYVLVLSSDVCEPASVLSRVQCRFDRAGRPSTQPVLAAARDEQVTILVPSTISPDEFLAAISEGIPGLRIGMSGSAVALRDAYEEAFAAWRIASRAPRSDVVIDVASLGELRFLLDIPDLAPLRDSVCARLAPVIEQDNRKHGPLLATLTTFLQESGRHTSTAAACGIHLSTLKYRLGRISELLGISLRDRNTQFSLRLDLKVLATVDQLGYRTPVSDDWRNAVPALVASSRPSGSSPRASSSVSS